MLSPQQRTVAFGRSEHACRYPTVTVAGVPPPGGSVVVVVVVVGAGGAGGAHAATSPAADSATRAPTTARRVRFPGRSVGRPNGQARSSTVNRSTYGEFAGPVIQLASVRTDELDGVVNGRKTIGVDRFDTPFDGSLIVTLPV